MFAAQDEGDRPRKAVAEAPADPGWAWAAYEPDAQRPWDLRRAGHLYRRAAFGADWQQLQQALRDGPRKTIDRLLRPDADVTGFNRVHDQYEAAAAGPGSNSVEGLRGWWLRRMILTPHPLLEKMTLFWHGHFALSNAHVRSAMLMHCHLQLLRSHALGNFATLLKGVLHDPATFLSLDARANRMAQRSEHLARAVLEEFCLGPNGCSLEDVRETARAFTGWFVFGDELRLIPREHDEGVKRIFAEEGNWQIDDVVRIVLAQPATPRRLVRGLYRWLISETDEPNAQLITPLAEALAKDYDVAKLVETMLRSNLFFSAAAYRQRIKSPVEFALGVIRGMEELVPTAPLGSDLAALGQALGQPPTAKGWEGGRAWLNNFTLLGRSNMAQAILSGSGPYGAKVNPAAVAKKHGFSDCEAVARFLLDLYVQGDVDERLRELLLKEARASAEAAGSDPTAACRRIAHLVATLPECQLA
jgi:uncharacterized protein (DUF1800 family)